MKTYNLLTWHWDRAYKLLALARNNNLEATIEFLWKFGCPYKAKCSVVCELWLWELLLDNLVMGYLTG